MFSIVSSGDVAYQYSLLSFKMVFLNHGFYSHPLTVKLIQCSVFLAITNPSYSDCDVRTPWNTSILSEDLCSNPTSPQKILNLYISMLSYLSCRTSRSTSAFVNRQTNRKSFWCAIADVKKEDVDADKKTKVENVAETHTPSQWSHSTGTSCWHHLDFFVLSPSPNIARF
jgi:hypothetical protein